MSCKGLDRNTKECCCHKDKKMHTQNYKGLDQDIKERYYSKRNVVVKEKMHTNTSCKWLDQDGEEHNCCKERETHKGDTIDCNKM